jgi:hypothetical protein
MVQYDKVSKVNRDGAKDGNDPVLAMHGIGKELWELEPGDRFVERLRSEEVPAPPPTEQFVGPADGLSETI